MLLGDKGYISSQIVEELIEQGLEFITTLKKNMKKKDMSFINRILLRKRAVVESVNDMLKNFFTIEHSRHRSVTGLINCVFTALIAYTFYPSKPKMRGIEIEKSIVAI